MSHEATAWAFKVRGLTAAQFRVLTALADCHNPSYGCFPTQGYLSESCEMSERTVRDTLSSLEERGLIARERKTNEWGHRTGTNYILGHESLPADISGRDEPTGNFTSTYRQNHVSPTGNYLPVDIEAEPVKEPVTEPVRNPIVPLQVVQGEVMDDFAIFWEAYPRKIARKAAEAAYRRARLRAKPPDILEGLERAKAQWRDPQFIPHATTWLNQERWKDEPDKHLQARNSGSGSIDIFIEAAQNVAARRAARTG